MEPRRLLKDPKEYSAWRILADISKKRDAATGSEKNVTRYEGDRSSSEDVESSFRAYWRTMTRDFIAPPNMRRLAPEEIEKLDTANKRRVQSGKSPQTCHSLDDLAPAPDGLFEWNPRRRIFGHRLQTPEQDEHEKSLKLTWLYRADDYVLATTLNGLFVLTRFYVKEGDIVAVLDGGKVPVIRRHVEVISDGEFEELYHFVCVDYVHGIMDGEAEEAVKHGWLEKRKILLA